jgi:hypothetical protein
MDAVAVASARGEQSMLHLARATTGKRQGEDPFRGWSLYSIHAQKILVKFKMAKPDQREEQAVANDVVSKS